MGIKSVSYQKQVKEQLAKSIFKALDATGFFVEGEAKRLTPVDTGNLRDKFSHKVTVNEGKVRISNTAKYAVFVEKGTGIFAEEGNGRKTPWVYVDSNGEYHYTRGQRPQPFLTPAVENNTLQITEIIRHNIKEGMKQ